MRFRFFTIQFPYDQSKGPFPVVPARDQKDGSSSVCHLVTRWNAPALPARYVEHKPAFYCGFVRLKGVEPFSSSPMCQAR